MDPFEKYEPWEDPQHKIDQYDNVKALIEEYKNKDSENNKKQKKECREHLKHILRHGSVVAPTNDTLVKRGSFSFVNN